MPFLYSDFSIPKDITDVPEVFIFEIVEPKYFLVRIAQGGLIQQIIKSGYTCNFLEPFSGLNAIAHRSLVFSTCGASGFA